MWRVTCPPDSSFFTFFIPFPFPFPFPFNKRNPKSWRNRSKIILYSNGVGASRLGLHRSCDLPSWSQFLLPRSLAAFHRPISQVSVHHLPFLLPVLVSIWFAPSAIVDSRHFPLFLKTSLYGSFGDSTTKFYDPLNLCTRILMNVGVSSA